MRKNGSIKKLFLGSLALICICCAVRADQVWYGDNTPDVVDENLTISGNCRLFSTDYDYVRITASSSAVDVYLTQTSEPTVIEGTYAVPTLFLEPINHDITFHIDHNLKFLGAYYDSAEEYGYRQPLLIVVRGGHNVIFEIDGKNITFDANVSNDPDFCHGGSVKLYVIMDGSTVQFNRTTLNPVSNSIITLGYHAAFGYASDQPLSSTGVGSILFDPTNSGTGRMALAIQDKASVLVSGRYTDLATSYSLTLDHIYKTIPAGCQAIFGTQNTDQTSAGAGLLILNSNATLEPYQIWHPKTFTGKTYGFILGCNGQISVGALTYFDYVGLTLDQCLTGNSVVPCSVEYLIDSCLCNLNCVGFNPNECCSIPAAKIFKKRNASALIVDGCCTCSALPACVNLEEQSAIVFRSGVNCAGVIENDLTSAYPFTISPIKRTTGAGNMVLDVEGCLTIAGTGTDRLVTQDQTKIEILSLHVTPTGATVLIDGTGSKNFPARDFAMDADGALRTYNSGYFFFNNNVILCKTFLVHTDQNHKVYDNDDVRSEPTYVGGEMFKLRGTVRPKLLFSNSMFMLHTSAATTGFDLVVPNALQCCMSCSQAVRQADQFADIHRSYDCYPTATCTWECTISSTCCLVNATPCDNVSNFIFFYDGYQMDKGTGRQLILGTVPGSVTCDCSVVISQDSHLDIMQLADQSCSCANAHELLLSVAPNNSTIIKGVPSNIAGQYAINTIYLGHASNISIGSPAGQIPEYYSCPILTLDGSYFSIQSRGGTLNKPQISNISGQGGVFVDYNGTIRAINTCGLTMGAMVTKSGNGVIDLPEPITHFGCGLGEADWRLDLSETPTIIAPGAIISDYVLNWNTCCIGSQFLPFTCNCNICPGIAAVSANVSGVPVVLGEVDQLLVRGSRIGDPATVKVGAGGVVRELVFPDSCRKGEAPTGVIVLENDGMVGLGSAHTNVDSLYGAVVLGNNGITIVANGDGRVHLNEDIVINNVCHIVCGPDFAASNRLLIESDCCRTILVKSSGILDLGIFTSGTIQLGGAVKLVLEPGAIVNMGSCTLQFLNNAGIVLQPASPEAMSVEDPTDLHALDELRVKFIGGTDGTGVGQGTILFDDCSYCIVNENAFMGIETGSTGTICGMCNGYTNLKIELRKKAQFMVGSCLGIGGAFQVGDTCCTDSSRSITFELNINGNDAQFYIGQGAFVGLGAVVASKLPGFVPNEWFVGKAGNVTLIRIEVVNGIFSHNVIWDGNLPPTPTDPYLIGSLLAIGTQDRFTLDFTGDNSFRVANVSRSTIRGGGNLMVVDSCPAPTQPNIQCTSDSTVGIMASGPLYQASGAFSGTGQQLFNFWKYFDFNGNAVQWNSRVDVGPFVRNVLRVGYVDAGAIVRSSQVKVTGSAGTTTDQAHTINIGAAAASLTSTTTTICGTVTGRLIQNLNILA